MVFVSGFSLANRSSSRILQDLSSWPWQNGRGISRWRHGMAWDQHARSPQIPWLIIIFAMKFAILDYPPGLGKPWQTHLKTIAAGACTIPNQHCLFASICNVYPNGQTAHIWATILKASRIPSCKQTLLVYLPTLSFLRRFVWIAHPLPGMALCNSVLDVGYEPWASGRSVPKKSLTASMIQKITKVCTIRSQMGWHPVNKPVPTVSMMEAAISNLRLYILYI